MYTTNLIGHFKKRTKRRIIRTEIIFERNLYRYFWNLVNYKDMHRYKIDIFTIYGISQYHYVASVYCDTNFLWLGSVKACQQPYSNFCFFLFVYRKWKVVFIYFTIITDQAYSNNRSPTKSYIWWNKKIICSYSPRCMQICCCLLAKSLPL